jgi:hypothetical protein
VPVLISPVTTALVLAWSGWCAADQRVLASRQIHQPLVAAVVAGLLLGHPERGLLLGVWMQLVWAAPLPVGGALLPDTGSAAVSATIISVMLPGEWGLLFGIVFGLIVAWTSIGWERRLRSQNERIEGLVRSQGGGRLPLAVASDFIGTFLRGLFYAAASFACGGLIGRFAWGIPYGFDSIGPVVRVGLIGGAAAVGYANLVLRFHTEAGSRAIGWIVGGLILGGCIRLIAGIGS